MSLPDNTQINRNPGGLHCFPGLTTVLAVALTLLVLLLHQDAKGQWEKIGSFPRQISNVYFMDQFGAPEIGFVSTWPYTDSIYVWRTSDSGNSWIGIRLAPEVPWVADGARDFTFKDKLNGWMANHVPFRTTDGGMTWTPLSADSGQHDVAIFYQPDTKLLFLSPWEPDTDVFEHARVSSDEGGTWKKFAKTPCGYAFSGLNGVLMGCVGDPTYYTSDGGATWSQSNFTDECFQPTCIPGTTTFFAASEKENRISRSDDGGKTWRTIFTYAPQYNPTETSGLDGCIRRDHCGNLYVLTMSEGLLKSSDEGVSWQSIGGPSAWLDARFWITSEFIYAGECAATADHDLSKPGALWRYRLPKYLESSFADGSKQRVMKAGDTVGVYYTIPGATDVDSFHLVVRFDSELDLKSIRFPSSWIILDSSTRNNVLDLWIKSNSFPQQSQLISLNFGTVLEKASAKVYLDSAHFYGNPMSSDCAALSLAGPDSVEIDFTGCGDSTLLRYMSGQSPLTLDAIVPNPSHSEVTLYYSLAGSENLVASIQIEDALGRTVVSRSVSLEAGPRRAIMLDLSGVASGVYNVRLGPGIAKRIVKE